jgi:hemerythrin-like domain-containing protein
MNTATQILRQEHEAILGMLDATEEAARRLAAGESVEPRVLEGLLEFFQLFADRCHHGKEEDLLFPKLAAKGMPSRMGPIGVMLAEHDEGRALIRQMKKAADEYKQGGPASRERWAQAARGYVDLLREHILKENNILFVMAERMLSDEEQRELSAAFEKVEEEKMGAGTHERLHALMEQLKAEIWQQKVAAR